MLLNLITEHFMLNVFLVIAVFWLAWSNGANDNFKGVATLYGSGTASYRSALIWSTLTTLAGSLLSVLLAGSLIKAFSGGGLVPDGLTRAPSLLSAVGSASAITILLATWLGMPTSTTHALTGALVGAALVADPQHINWSTLISRFAQPLLISPVIAIALAALLYAAARILSRRTGMTQESCLCVGDIEAAPVGIAAAALCVTAGGAPTLMIASSAECAPFREAGAEAVTVRGITDRLHYLSGGAVCVARALNDTPKIAALLLGTGSALGSWQIALVTAAMAVGGLMGARRVAQTISKRITKLDDGQGLAASLVTASLVLGASRLGVPVSTTHVSCGSLFGIGMVSRRQNWKVIVQILTTWVTTLPLGLALGAGIFWFMRKIGA